jgi:hypothetical protein
MITGDWLVTLSWCLLCGFDSPIPYFQAIYFLILLIHRQVWLQRMILSAPLVGVHTVLSVRNRGCDRWKPVLSWHHQCLRQVRGNLTYLCMLQGNTVQ